MKPPIPVALAESIDDEEIQCLSLLEGEYSFIIYLNQKKARKRYR